MPASLSYHANDPSLESQWRAILLFGKNSATYKFAFAQALLELVDKEIATVTLQDLAEPFSRHLIAHLRHHDKQGSAASSTFLDACRGFIQGRIPHADLMGKTEKLGFVNVVDAFQVVNGGRLAAPFYEVHKVLGRTQLVLTDHIFRLKESVQFQNFGPEANARWQLVETAWNLQIRPNLLQVQHDETRGLFFVEHQLLRRVDVTSVREALNGYQKGKCFYSFQDIAVHVGAAAVCQVDHFLPHLNKAAHLPADLNGVWNLVLADAAVNRHKSARVPELHFLERLYRRNEFFIESKHPLSETIANQTGPTPEKRQQFLRHHYQVALNQALHRWAPSTELPATF